MRDIRMTTKELKKIEVLALVNKGEMKMSEGARKLGLTKRHLRRLRMVYEKEGGEGISHKSRGRRSRNAFPEKLEEEIAKLLHERYSDFGPTFAAEKIGEDLGRTISKRKDQTAAD